MPTQSWSGKSAVFLIESALTSHGSSKSNKKRRTTEESRTSTCGAGTGYTFETPAFTPGFKWVRVTRSLVLCLFFVEDCLSFFFWSLFCLSFDLRIFITPLVYIQTLLKTSLVIKIYRLNTQVLAYFNRIGGWMVSVLDSSAVDRGFEPRSGQTKYYKMGICCFSATHVALRRKSNVWLARNRANVSLWGDMSIHGLFFSVR